MTQAGTAGRVQRGARRGAASTAVLTLLASLVLAVAFLTLAAPPASAGHSQLLSTSPADGSVLAAPPSEVVFTFDAPLLPDTPTVSINDADGQVVSSIHPAPDGDSVSIPWPTGTSPGDYQVAFRVVCADGEPLVGAIPLTISDSGDAASASTATAAPPTAAPVADSVATPAKGLPVAAILAVVAVIVGIAVVALVYSGRRRQSSTGGTSHGPLH